MIEIKENDKLYRMDVFEISNCPVSQVKILAKTGKNGKVVGELKVMGVSGNLVTGGSFEEKDGMDISERDNMWNEIVDKVIEGVEVGFGTGYKGKITKRQSLDFRDCKDNAEAVEMMLAEDLINVKSIEGKTKEEKDKDFGEWLQKRDEGTHDWDTPEKAVGVVKLLREGKDGKHRTA